MLNNSENDSSDSSVNWVPPNKKLRSDGPVQNLPGLPAKKLVFGGVEMQLRRQINQLKMQLKQESASLEK